MITQLSDIKVVLIVRLFRHLRYRERNLKKSITFEWKHFPDKSWKGIIISQVRFFAATNELAWISPVLLRFSWKSNVLWKMFQIYHIPLLKLLKLLFFVKTMRNNSETSTDRIIFAQYKVKTRQDKTRQEAFFRQRHLLISALKRNSPLSAACNSSFP